MEEFLRESKKVNLEAVEAVEVVLGNEACDLDSAACAIAYAYHLRQLNDQSKPRCRVCVVPVLNIVRADFSLRTDIRHVLARHSVTPDLLTFRDDLDLRSVRRSGRLRLTLVDLNNLPAEDGDLEGAVVEVIDHRARTRAEDKNVQVTLEMVGSCSTLVAERLLASGLPIPPLSIDLLYNAILADTVCLAAAAGRTTPKDERVVGLLETLISRKGRAGKNEVPAPTRQQAFDEINRIKQDVAGLCTADLLRKDLKLVGGGEESRGGTSIALAFCAIMEDMLVFWQRRDVVCDIARFQKDRRVSAVILMFMHVDAANTPSRELAVYSPDAALRSKLCAVLEGASSPSLDLRKVAHQDSNIAAYIQGNVKATRKLVLPLITASLK